jgi:deoxycytidylate deaminase
MRGPCAKRQVICYLYIQGYEQFAVRGENDCANPQPTCPRLPGEGYEKCRSICRQEDHAEMMALRKARELGYDLKDASATISGHYWICEPCGRALLDAGISKVFLGMKKHERIKRT